MKIYLMGEWAFVDCRKEKCLLCIGSKDEVDGANPEQLAHMIFFALAVSDYQALEKAVVMH